MMRFFVPLAALLGLASSVTAHLSNETNVTAPTSFISVNIPFHLHNSKGEEHVEAEFGISGSGSLASYVYLVDNYLCGVLALGDRNNTYPKHPGPMKTPFILMGLSAGCGAVAKARVAQLGGASALLIAHDVCRCSDKNCTDSFGPECTDEAVVLVNDGSAGDVSIPSFLLYKSVATNIMEELKKDQPVLMELTWGLKVPTGPNPPPVQYHLWSTAQ
jgi:hypothetical protein